MHISWARLASFCHLGFISDPLIVSKFHNETHDPKGQENKFYTIVKGRETFFRRHTVPVTSCSEVKYVLKRVSFGSKDCTKELKLEYAYFLGQTSKFLPFRLHQWHSNSFKVPEWNPCLQSCLLGRHGSSKRREFYSIYLHFILMTPIYTIWPLYLTFNNYNS